MHYKQTCIDDSFHTCVADRTMRGRAKYIYIYTREKLVRLLCLSQDGNRKAD